MTAVKPSDPKSEEPYTVKVGDRVRSPWKEMFVVHHLNGGKAVLRVEGDDFTFLSTTLPVCVIATASSPRRSGWAVVS